MEIVDLRLPHEIIHKYPYPLAIAAARVNDSTEHVEKFLALARLAEITLKYLAVIGMAQYLPDPDWDEQIQSELQKLPGPSLGVWNSILSTCMAFYGSKSLVRHFCMPELREGYAAKLDKESPAGQAMLEWTRFVTEYLDGKPGGRQSVSLKEVLDLIVRYRDKTWGHGVPQLTSEFCAEHGVKLVTGLEGLLRAMDYLPLYPLRYIKEMRKVRGQDVHIMFDYMGTMGRQGAAYIGEYTQETRLYVCDQEGKPCVCLSPLFVLNERRVYVLD